MTDRTADKKAARDLTRGSVRRHLLRLTWPMTFGILAMLSTSVVDTYFVATLGTDALSALSFSFPVFMTIAGLSIGLGAGATSVVSRSIGRGDERLIKRRCTDALILAFIMVSLLAMVGYIWVRPLFSLLGASGNVLDLVVAYMQILFLGLSLLVIPMMGNSLIRAAGDARVPGMIMVSGAALNAILDPILIFGWLGAPALGIRGAALATVIANGVTLVIALGVLYFREHMIDLNKPKFEEVIDSFKKILHVGLPASAANMINPIGLAILTALLAQTGKESVAAFGVATRIESIAYVGLLALSASIGPVIGQNWGAGLRRRVKLALTRSFQFCLVYGLALAVGLAAASFVLPGLFTDNPDIARLSRHYLWIVPITAFGFGINIAAAGALNAAGWPLVSAALTFIRMFLVAVPFALFFTPSWGPYGVFGAIGAANLVAAAVSAWAAYRVADRYAPRQQPAAAVS